MEKFYDKLNKNLTTLDKLTVENVIHTIKQTLKQEKQTVVPIIPSKGLLISMAIRDDHSFGVDKIETGPYKIGYTNEERYNMLSHMKQLHEEVVGTGFYSEERDSYYTKMLKKDTD